MTPFRVRPTAWRWPVPLLVTAPLLLALGGCAPKSPLGFHVATLEREIRYCREFRDYLELDGPKALAVAGDPGGSFVSGLAFKGTGRAYEEDEPTLDQKTADSRAMQRCEARRFDRNLRAPCALHAQGECPTEQSRLSYCCEISYHPERCPASVDPPKAECP